MGMNKTTSLFTTLNPSQSNKDTDYRTNNTTYTDKSNKHTDGCEKHTNTTYHSALTTVQNNECSGSNHTEDAYLRPPSRHTTYPTEEDKTHHQTSSLKCNNTCEECTPDMYEKQIKCKEWNDLIDLVMNSYGLEQSHDDHEWQTMTLSSQYKIRSSDTMALYWPYNDQMHRPTQSGVVDTGDAENTPSSTNNTPNTPIRYPYQLFTCDLRPPTYAEFHASHTAHSTAPRNFQQQYDDNLNQTDREVKHRVEQLNLANIQLTVHQIPDNVTNTMSIKEALCALTIIHTHTAHSRGVTFLDTARNILSITKVTNNDILADLAKYVTMTCPTCAICNNMYGGQRTHGTVTATYHNEKVHLDIADCGIACPYKPFYNYRQALIMVDVYTGMITAAPIPDKHAETIRDTFITKYVDIYGVPNEVHTDGGTEFQGLFRKYLNSMGTTHTPYHLSANTMEYLQKTQYQDYGQPYVQN
jgi:hypothetical protein